MSGEDRAVGVSSPTCVREPHQSDELRLKAILASLPDYKPMGNPKNARGDRSIGSNVRENVHAAMAFHAWNDLPCSRTLKICQGPLTPGKRYCGGSVTVPVGCR